MMKTFIRFIFYTNRTLLVWSEISCVLLCCSHNSNNYSFRHSGSFLCFFNYKPWQTQLILPFFFFANDCSFAAPVWKPPTTHPSLCSTLTWLFCLGLLCSLHFPKLLCSALSVSPCPSARWHSILSTASIIWPRAAKHANCCALTVKQWSIAPFQGFFCLGFFTLLISFRSRAIYLKKKNVVAAGVPWIWVARTHFDLDLSRKCKKICVLSS